MRSIGEFARRNPRSVASFAFGISTAALTHFAWYANARMNGMIPALTLGAGLAHAVAGALTGPRLTDTERTRTPAQAGVLGGMTSLLAVGFLAPVMAWYVSVTNLQTSVLGYAVITLFTALFAFLAAGWALLLLCMGVGLALHRLSRGALRNGDGMPHRSLVRR
jgi:hypothetical protein